jgi:hypothetical protein
MRRSNPWIHKGSMDCFVALLLAMTVLERSPYITALLRFIWRQPATLCSTRESCSIE